MLRYCYAQDRSFTFGISNFFGVQIGVWTIFGLILETFLNLSHLILIPFSFTKVEAEFFPPSNLPDYGFGLISIVMITVVLQVIILPFAFTGFLTLNRRIFFVPTIFTVFQSLQFFISGILAISYHTVTSTRPLTFLGIQLLLSVPIHLFCGLIFVNFTKFSQFHSESIKKNYDFGNFVERTYLAIKKQKNQLHHRKPRGGY